MTINASRLLAPQHAARKMVNMAKVVQNMVRRPKTSEQGAQMSGPTTKPSTKPDVTDMFRRITLGSRRTGSSRRTGR